MAVLAGIGAALLADRVRRGRHGAPQAPLTIAQVTEEAAAAGERALREEKTSVPYVRPIHPTELKSALQPVLEPAILPADAVTALNDDLIDGNFRHEDLTADSTADDGNADGFAGAELPADNLSAGDLSAPDIADGEQSDDHDDFELTDDAIEALNRNVAA